MAPIQKTRIRVTRQSQLTGKYRTRDLPITEAQIKAWQAGELIQNVMPELSASDREFLISGVTQEEWDEVRKSSDLPMMIPAKRRSGMIMTQTVEQRTERKWEAE